MVYAGGEHKYQLVNAVFNELIIVYMFYRARNGIRVDFWQKQNELRVYNNISLV